MAVAAGSRFGAFEIIGSLGAGGMGEVYRARDTRLKREVALKLLPDGVADDPDRIARFQREAEVLATLSHPHIAAIYGLEEAGAPTDARPTRALVLELVEGPTLAEVIARGPLPWADAGPLAHQLAEALDYAHERGVLHRDLKPANIKVTPEGQVKVLDFGLAKLGQNQAPDSGLQALGAPGSDSPTITTPAMTQAGMLIGTAAYMAPEQARGQAMDKRADIWAFGCVLYEMLSGTRTFAGETLSDTLAAVLRAEPDWAALPADMPHAVTRLLRRCLTRDPKRRLRDIGEAVVALAEPAGDDATASGRSTAAQSTGVSAVSPSPSSSAAHRYLPWAIALVALAMAVAMAVRDPVVVPGASAEALRPVYSFINAPLETESAFEAGFALSPNGELLAFRGRDAKGLTSLWIRTMSTGAIRSVPAARNPAFPFWSPDGREVAFWSDGELKRVAADGQTPLQITGGLPSLAGFGGATWLDDGTVVYAGLDEPLKVVPASGGIGRELSTQPALPRMRWPVAVPGTRHVVAWVPPGLEQPSGFYRADLDGRVPPQSLVEHPSGLAASALLLGPGRMAYSNSRVSSALVARSLVGEPTEVALFPEVANNMGWSNVSSSADGRRIVLRQRTTSLGVHTLDRSGAARSLDVPPLTNDLRLSPDGGSLLYASSNDLWSLDVARNTKVRLTTTPEGEGAPMWSRNGARIIFKLTGQARWFVLDVRTRDQKQLECGSRGLYVGADISPDEKSILVATASADGSNIDLFNCAIDTQEFVPLTNTPFDEVHPRYSPDGRWLAFVSDESGDRDVYVRRLGSGVVSRISTRGGDFPMWRGDTRELVYITADGTFMSVPVNPAAREPFQEPVPLFKARVRFIPLDSRRYDMTPDGQRFIVELEDERPEPLVLIDNWAPPKQN